MSRTHRRQAIGMVVAVIVGIAAVGGGTATAHGLITGAKIKDGSVTGADIADNSLKGADVHESTLGTVPRASRATSAGNVLSAAVNSNGSLDRATHAGTTSTGSDGFYQVRFPRNVRDCVYTATVGLTGDLGVSEPGEVTTVGENASENGVFLTTHASNGAFEARGFHLTVVC